MTLGRGHRRHKAKRNVTLEVAAEMAVRPSEVAAEKVKAEMAVAADEAFQRGAALALSRN